MAEIILSSGDRFDIQPGVSILDAAGKSGVFMPYSCKSGRCSTCKCKVLSGETTVLQAEMGLTDGEKAEGWILSCVRSASADVVLESEDLGGIELPAVKTLPCRIGSLEKLAPDVLRVVLRLPPTAVFDFLPGQYIDIIGADGVRRSYSLASAQAGSKTLELHIRAVEGGAMSAYWFGQAKVNDLLRLNGPLGTFFLRRVAGLDLIFLATGTGIAPVKAILESIEGLAEEQRPRSVTVLWGGRVAEDLYADIAAIGARHRYVPVLSRADAGWTGSRGHVQDVLLSLEPDLDNAVVYACGSDAMIHGAQDRLVRAGLPANRFYSDAFVCSAPTSAN
ncbi:FAD-binding oxidoreductase [Massilia phyllosphaerae]|uniref:FAD-binding oxidoreductase n=1 Tax=Massilia phyllosphaerae TaxID=3106034 RepID=UPI002B1CDB55|nr:FAD-binding oxidoreductase [Massilia sp. SGZ-792]